MHLDKPFAVKYFCVKLLNINSVFRDLSSQKEPSIQYVPKALRSEDLKNLETMWVGTTFILNNIFKGKNRKEKPVPEEYS